MLRTKSHSEDNQYFFEKILSQMRFNKIIRFVPENSDVLDLGCGYHGLLLRFLEMKISFGVGVDISVNQEVRSPKLRLVKHDLNKALPFPNDRFDVVISLANLEHLENSRGVFQEIHRVMKPGGLLLLTTPTPFAKPVLEFLSYELKIISEEEIRDHKTYFQRQMLENYCKMVGFSYWEHKYFQIGMNNFLRAVK
jgi:SAM-dependent methyltransferase